MAISEPKNQYAPANPTTTKDSQEAIADSTFDRINVRSPTTTFIDADAFQKRVLSHEGAMLLDKRNALKAEYEKRYADAVAPIDTRLQEIYMMPQYSIHGLGPLSKIHYMLVNRVFNTME